MKKVQLKNMITEVPDNSTLVENWSTLKKGDFVLIVWDNPRFTANIEKNHRLYTEIKYVENRGENKTMISFGGHYTEKADKLNATTCSGGVNYQTLGKEDNYPHVIFLVD
jgi:hypothetical protein